MRKSNLFFKSNEQIRVPSLRVISSNGKQIGIVTKEEALKKAREENLDLVLIAEYANPPVAKITNLGKFIYSEEKKLKKQKTRSGDLKEIRFSPFIGEADYETRLKRIEEFVKNKDKVKLTVVFKTKQLGSKSFGYQVLGKIVERLGDKIHVDSEPKFLGKRLSMIISPKSNRENKHAKNKNEKINSKEV